MSRYSPGVTTDSGGGFGNFLKGAASGVENARAMKERTSTKKKPTSKLAMRTQGGNTFAAELAKIPYGSW